MQRTTVIRPPRSEWDYERPQMDWIGIRNKLDRLSAHTPYRWMRIEAGQPERIRPWKIREKLRAKAHGTDYQIRQVLSGTHKGGDVQPTEWLTGEFEAERNLAQLERQKTESGEKALWDTWVRVTPPATLSKAQAREQKSYTNAMQKVDEQIVEDHRVRSADELRAEDIAALPTLRQRASAQAEWARELIQVEIDYKYALRENHREGEVGLRDWQVAVARERIEASRVKHERIAQLGRDRKKTVAT